MPAKIADLLPDARVHGPGQVVLPREGQKQAGSRLLRLHPALFRLRLP